MFEDLPRNLIVPKALGMITVLIVPNNFEPTFSEIWERDPKFDDAVDYRHRRSGGFPVCSGAGWRPGCAALAKGYRTG